MRQFELSPSKVRMIKITLDTSVLPADDLIQAANGFNPEFAFSKRRSTAKVAMAVQ
jgi:hypothetical protein